MKPWIGAGISGFGAGALNGLFGAGGGMVLAPLLGTLTDTDDSQLFSNCVAILLPVCVVSLLFSSGWENFSFFSALPYLGGSVLGGIAAGVWGKHIRPVWLHRALGVLILWGGIRYLW